MSVADNVKQARILSGYIPKIAKNEPEEYADKQHEFFSAATALFRQNRLKYASDFVKASVQTKFYRGGGEWKDINLRFANVVRPSSAIQRNFDDYKQVIPEEPHIGYLQPGAKIKCMGSTWLVVNPDNISGGEGSAIIRRCNAVWNYLDFYGNIISEPIIVENARANASSPDTQAQENIATGYFQVTCQYNDFTRQANDNTRIILGDAGNPYENAKAYQITGFGNFFREFTDDKYSVNLLTFTIRVLTKNDDADDLVNCVAGAKNFSWDAFITGASTRPVGSSNMYFTVKTIRNGEEITSPWKGHPFVYEFSVSDESIATMSVTSSNQVRLNFLKTGTVTLTATLLHNPNIVATKVITVTEAEKSVKIGQNAPETMHPFQTVRITAFPYDEQGLFAPGVPVSIVCSGAREGSYGYSYPVNYTIEVTCYGYSETPLVVTAYGSGDYEGLSDSIEIRLEGL